MDFFHRDIIVFYTLILNQQEIEIYENKENLIDFLENKICILLNLQRDKEYFLYYTVSREKHIYHCILIDKEKLKFSVKNANIYLTHPCFLGGQFVEKGYILIKDTHLEWMLVGYCEQNIVDFYALEDLRAGKIRLESLQLKEFWLWEVGEITKNEWGIIEALQLRFSIHFLQKDVEDAKLVECFNFNPLEQSKPFLKTQAGKVLKCFTSGIALGLVFLAVLIFLGLMQQKENQALQAQINHLQNTLDTLGKSRTQTQKELLDLQEELESLRGIYEANANFLKGVGGMDIQVAQFIYTLNPYLQELNVKIAYFGLEQGQFALLLFGVNALKILEILERESLGQIEAVRVYKEFVWSEIKRVENGF